LANGQTTSFWHDVWDEHDSLAERFPELFSHCRDQELTVQQVFDGGLQRFLTARQSSMATEQLIQVQEIMEQHQVVDGKDRR
jgi:copper homeostasis protein CutC